MDPNPKPEKQVENPLSTQAILDIPIELKGQFYVRARVGEARAGIKRKMLHILPMPESHGNAEQLKLLPGRKPIIQMNERLILQPLKIVTQPNIQHQA